MNPIFLDHDSSLAELVAAGWRIEYSSQGGWWFRNKDTQERQAVPYWIAEMVHNAQQAGMESMQAQFHAVVKGKPQYLGPCNPFIPNKAATKAKD